MLKEVRHVPILKRYLISARQWGSEGYIITFIDDLWKVTKVSLIILGGEKVGTMFCVLVIIIFLFP